MLEAVGIAALAAPEFRAGDPPLVSVVIPTCNRPETLVDAVQSVFAQAAVTVEVIVIDGSPEYTAVGAIEALGDSLVRYVANPEPSRGALRWCATWVSRCHGVQEHRAASSRSSA
jgi:hypothetical protein